MKMFHVVQEKMERYLDFLSFLICPCKSHMHFGKRYFKEYDLWDFFKQRYANEKDQESYFLIDRKEKLTHHEGSIIDLISSGKKPITEEMISKWENDIEHGVLHGFFVGFIAFLYKYDCVIPKSSYSANHEKDVHDDTKLIASCLFHDFAKTIGLNDHDLSLKQYFPDLCEETYRHANPPKSDDLHPLIAGDRTELRRFAHHESWCDKDVLRRYFVDNSVVEHFYSKTRPALEEIYNNRNSIWLRHGIDVPPEGVDTNITGESFYPMKHWHKKGYNEAEDYWSVEVGKAPFTNCMLHTHKYAPWGIITLDQCRKRRVNVRKVWSRDHFGAKGKIALKDWVFILPAARYDTINEIHHVILNLCKGFVSVEIANKMLWTLDQLITLLRVSAANKQGNIKI